MVEETVLKDEPFDEQKKKYLKKYIEHEGLSFEILEKNLEEFFELTTVYQKSPVPSLKNLLFKHAELCYLNSRFFEFLISELLFRGAAIEKIDAPNILLTEPDDDYQVVYFGSQIWMAENLNIDYFSNGDLIPEAKTDDDWRKAALLGMPAWCNYENNPDFGENYGKLYNWYAVNDPRGLHPIGWRLPSKKDIEVLLRFVGGNGAAAYKSFEKNGKFGFNEMFSGLRNADHSAIGNQSFYFQGTNGGFWSLSPHGLKYAWCLSIQKKYQNAALNSIKKDSGFSIRCLLC